MLSLKVSGTYEKQKKPTEKVEEKVKKTQVSRTNYISLLAKTKSLVDSERRQKAMPPPGAGSVYQDYP